MSGEKTFLPCVSLPTRPLAHVALDAQRRITLATSFFRFGGWLSAHTVTSKGRDRHQQSSLPPIPWRRHPIHLTLNTSFILWKSPGQRLTEV